MAQAYLDRVDTLKMERQHGIVTKLTRKTRITDLDSTDYTVLVDAIQTLGLPTVDSFLVNPAAARKNDPLGMLVLVHETIDLVDNTTVDITHEFEHFMRSTNQEVSIDGLFPTFSDATSLYGKHRSFVQQTKTNFYPALTAYRLEDSFRIPVFNPLTAYLPGAQVDYNGFYWYLIGPGLTTPNLTDGNWRLADYGSDFYLAEPEQKRLIVVGHTFPNSGPNKDDKYGGQTKYQTGEISVMQPHSNFTLSGHCYAVRDMGEIEKGILGKINQFTWQFGDPEQWMCMEMKWSMESTGYMYLVDFEFQKNLDGWQPTAVYHDQRIGRPPPELLADFGYRTIPYHEAIDFDAFFANIFEGLD